MSSTLAGFTESRANSDQYIHGITHIPAQVMCELILTCIRSNQYFFTPQADIIYNFRYSAH